MNMEEELLQNDCPICCYSVTKCEIVICYKCKNICCRECFQHYLIISDKKSQCMHCGVNLELYFIKINVSNKWFETEYNKFRKLVLWKNELPIIQDIQTQKAAEAYMNAHCYLQNANNQGFYDITKLQNIINNVYERENFDKKENKKNKERIKILNALLCIDQLGKNWENFDFEKCEPRILNLFANNITYPCSVYNCRGIISDNICNICCNKFCAGCREIIKNDSHECDINILASVRSIMQNSHPCPKCATPISKISGCDQMFCTQCHTTFSWNTGLIITHNLHNPHYFDWLFNQNNLKPLARLNEENTCNQFISYQNLLSCFQDPNKNNYDIKKKTKKLPQILNLYEKLPLIEHYFVAFLNLRESILYVRSTSGNHVNIGYPDNHDLRIKLITNEINEEEFKSVIEKRDYDFRKSMCYWEVYSTVFEISSILFDNLFVYTHKRTKIKKKKEEYFHELYIYIQTLLEQANNQILCLHKAFGKDERLIYFQRHPFYFNRQ